MNTRNASSIPPTSKTWTLLSGCLVAFGLVSAGFLSELCDYSDRISETDEPDCIFVFFCLVGMSSSMNYPTLSEAFGVLHSRSLPNRHATWKWKPQESFCVDYQQKCDAYWSNRPFASKSLERWCACAYLLNDTGCEAFKLLDVWQNGRHQVVRLRSGEAILGQPRRAGTLAAGVHQVTLSSCVYSDTFNSCCCVCSERFGSITNNHSTFVELMEKRAASNKTARKDRKTEF